MIHYPLLDGYAERYVGLATMPLVVTLTLKQGAQLAGYDNLLLDNLLGACLVNEATGWKGLPDSEEGYAIPLPLRCLWRDAEGFPLWAATPFTPDGEWFKDVWYRHKKSPTGRFTATKSGRFNISPTDGRFMERRVPVPTTVAERFVAFCDGNVDEIARLLGLLTAAGRDRARGLGAIEHFDIDEAVGFFLADGSALTRSIPAEAIRLLGNWTPQEPPSLISWTPPQWKPGLWRPGWRAGVRIEPEEWMPESESK